MTCSMHPLRRTAPAAVAALLSAGLLAGCGSGGDKADDLTSAPSQSDTAASPATSDAATTSTTATSSAAPTQGDTDVLLYWGVDGPMGLRLAAERTPVTGDPVDAALQALLAGKAIDPDYAGLVPADSITSATVVPGKEITLQVASPAYADASEDIAPQGNKLAVQSLLYSLNAAAGTAKKPLPVHFVDASGKDSTYLAQPSTSKPGPELQTLALMNVLSPADGSPLTAGKATFSGVGSSFEATVGWKIQDSTGKTVQQGSTTAAGWDRLYPWKATVDLSTLSAGTYTFVASTDDPSDGEGPGPSVDDKTFTIG